MKTSIKVTTHCCNNMTAHLTDSEIGLSYTSKFHEYSLDYHDGGSSVQQIYFCPWCGTHLGQSKREEWFEKLEANGIDPFSKAIPLEFQSDEWWRNSNSFKPQ